jgi:hypothetical protein
VFETNSCNYKLVLQSIAGCPTQCITGGSICSGNGICGYDTDAQASRCYCYTGYAGDVCSGPASDKSGMSAEGIILIVVCVVLALVLGVVVFMFFKLRKLQVDPAAYGELQGRCEYQGLREGGATGCAHCAQVGAEGCEEQGSAAVPVRLLPRSAPSACHSTLWPHRTACCLLYASLCDSVLTPPAFRAPCSSLLCSQRVGYARISTRLPAFSPASSPRRAAQTPVSSMKLDFSAQLVDFAVHDCSFPNICDETYTVGRMNAAMPRTCAQI